MKLISAEQRERIRERLIQGQPSHRIMRVEGVTRDAVRYVSAKTGIPITDGRTNQPREIIGTVCPTCGGGTAGVTDSRPAEVKGVPVVRRRRCCSGCSEKWTTYEISEADLENLGDRERLTREILAKLMAMAAREIAG